jgi:hypothetical protein
MVLSFVGLFFIPCDRKTNFEHYQRKSDVKLIRVIIYGTDANIPFRNLKVETPSRFKIVGL